PTITLSKTITTMNREVFAIKTKYTANCFSLVIPVGCLIHCCRIATNEPTNKIILMKVQNHLVFFTSTQFAQ
ncbi:hypothetical protein, partial [Bartonella apihabitans]|uniref:hypothetical protein n=1 Tax=Bartonella apihabitans TaxID=2750929 RepID=UPI001AEE8722